MNQNCSRHSRWHTGFTCLVLADKDLQVPKPTSDQRREASTQRLYNESYECQGFQFSMGKETCKEFLDLKDIDRLITYTMQVNITKLKQSTHNLFVFLSYNKHNCYSTVSSYCLCDT